MSVDAQPAKSYPVTWEQQYRDSRALAWKLLERRGTFHGIIAATRGGLVPAAVIARELDIRRAETVCFAHAGWEAHIEACRKLTSFDANDKGCLIVDDLADEGHAAGEIRRLRPAACLAVLYVKPQSKALADAFITEVSGETWLSFPWGMETEHSPRVERGQGCCRQEQ